MKHDDTSNTLFECYNNLHLPCSTGDLLKCCSSTLSLPMDKSQRSFTLSTDLAIYLNRKVKSKTYEGEIFSQFNKLFSKRYGTFFRRPIIYLVAPSACYVGEAVDTATNFDVFVSRV